MNPSFGSGRDRQTSVRFGVSMAKLGRITLESSIHPVLPLLSRNSHTTVDINIHMGTRTSGPHQSTRAILPVAIL